MARVALKPKNYPKAKINQNNYYATIKDKNSIVQIAEVLPFRVRFQNINIGGYSPSNPPPIGIAVIGLNNYIL
jgi:hypothetical protein